MPEFKHTMFICLGGTGTQIGTAIGNIYPLLKESGISKDTTSYSMFIMDKDTMGKNYEYCVNASNRYKSYCDTLPFTALNHYKLEKEVYQELQRDAGRQSKDYTVMDLIGTDPEIRALAGMCWKQEKCEEKIRDGNNRDPSRGSLDAHVCLEHFENCSLFKQINEAVDQDGENSVRVVILGGATGGMGSSLIVPMVKRIKSKFGQLRIDMVILGTYFVIPENPDKKNKVNDIGNTLDSYYRVKDQIIELEEFIKEYPKDKWWVYYAAIPGFDDICGEFAKNGAEKRHAHFLELTAALSAFSLEFREEPGFYLTTLPSNEGIPTNVGWEEIPFGKDLKTLAGNFMRLISIMACQVYPRFMQDRQKLVKDLYIKLYINRPGDDMEKLAAISGLIKEWLNNIIPYFEFWNEIQEYTMLGSNRNGIINFFIVKNMEEKYKYKDMEKMSKILAEILNNPKAAWMNNIPLNKMPLCRDTWANYLPEIKPDKDRLAGAGASQDSKELIRQIIKDIYIAIAARKED